MLGLYVMEKVAEAPCTLMIEMFSCAPWKITFLNHIKPIDHG